MNHSALGGTWDDLEKELLDKGYLTREEIVASDARVARIGARLQRWRDEEGHEASTSKIFRERSGERTSGIPMIAAP